MEAALNMKASGRSPQVRRSDRWPRHGESNPESYRRLAGRTARPAGERAGRKSATRALRPPWNVVHGYLPRRKGQKHGRLRHGPEGPAPGGHAALSECPQNPSQRPKAERNLFSTCQRGRIIRTSWPAGHRSRRAAPTFPSRTARSARMSSRPSSARPQPAASSSKQGWRILRIYRGEWHSVNLRPG